MCATSCALLALLSLNLSRPACAGTWKFTCTGSGSNTVVHPPSTGAGTVVTKWTPPGPQTGSFSVGTFGSEQDYSTSDATTITVTVTGTWVPAAGQTGTSDPAPPSVWLYESGQSEWTYGKSGSADDGLGETATPTAASSGIARSSSAPPSVPPAHWKSYPVSGSAVKLPARTLKAEGDFPVTADRPQGDNCGSYIDSYTVNVHPTPYNFHKVPGQGHIMPDGTLIFVYDWFSTDGNKNDLTTCYWHEYVTYSGPIGTAVNPIKYYPPDPPFNFPLGISWLPNPTVNPGPPLFGGSMTGSNQVTDTQGVPPLVAPSSYTYGTFTANQVYQFNDAGTGQTNVQIPGPDSGPFSIVREFKITDLHDYTYTCTKDGKTASAAFPF